MSRILVISGHPDLGSSFANRRILAALSDVPDLTLDLRPLDSLYPDFAIDVAAEQAALLAADAVVWQFPFHWYAFPALMKKWVDDVLTHGFAYGTGGDRLKDKPLLISFTTGAPEAQYAEGEAMNYPVEAFLPALKQTGLLCGMAVQDPIWSNGMIFIPGVSTEEDAARIEASAARHAARVIALLRDLSSDRDVA